MRGSWRRHHDPEHGDDDAMTTTTAVLSETDYKVADLSLAAFGRKEIRSPSTRCPA